MMACWLLKFLTLFEISSLKIVVFFNGINNSDL